MYGLTLSEHVRHDLSASLLLREPTSGRLLLVGLIMDNNIYLVVESERRWEIDGKWLSQFWVGVLNSKVKLSMMIISDLGNGHTAMVQGDRGDQILHSQKCERILAQDLLRIEIKVQNHVHMLDLYLVDVGEGGVIHQIRALGKAGYCEG